MTRSTRRLITALLLAVALYGVAVAYNGFGEMRHSLGAFQWSAFAGAVVLASMNYLLRFVRWDYYLKLLDVRGVSKWDSLLLFLSGFVLTITPGKVGEVFKSAVLNQTHGVPIARTAPVVIAERLTDLIGVVALIFLGSIGFESGGYWAIAGAAIIVVALVGVMWKLPLDYLLGWVTRHARFGRFAPKLREAIDSLRLLAGPSAIAWPMVLSIVAWACEGVALWVLLVGFRTKAPLLLSVFFYETASLAGALIPIPGGLGVVEGMIHEQLVRLGGASTTVATASMILIRLATLWWAVVVGFIALAILRARYPKLRGVEP
jgi:glycosyltransferase 2 family protein